MGKLVQFERRERGPEATKSERPGKAEILMFTGVRYERTAPNSLPTKPSATPRTKRKGG